MYLLRFAPSLTGLVHLGNLRILLYIKKILLNIRYILILRIDDTDSLLGIDNCGLLILISLIRVLKLFKITYNKYIYFQSNRLRIYYKYLKLYYFRHFFTIKKGGLFIYFNDFKIIFRDVLWGIINFNFYGEVLICRSCGVPSYNFCCSIDDFLMDMVLIIRGFDHLLNTPFQLFLLYILGFYNCYYIHLGLLLSNIGSKLSKKDRTNYSIRFCLMYGIFIKTIYLYLTFGGLLKKHLLFNYNKLLWLNKIIYYNFSIKYRFNYLFKIKNNNYKHLRFLILLKYFYYILMNINCYYIILRFRYIFIKNKFLILKTSLFNIIDFFIYKKYCSYNFYILYYIYIKNLFFKNYIIYFLNYFNIKIINNYFLIFFLIRYLGLLGRYNNITN